MYLMGKKKLAHIVKTQVLISVHFDTEYSNHDSTMKAILSGEENMVKRAF